MAALPTIIYKRKKYTFDYRLGELRWLERGKLHFMTLSGNDSGMIDYAIRRENKKLLKELMKEIFRY